ncbi:hypothetical protein PsorP6_017740 [Peronosclerospora sorghi]|uniref:Uncharacterized protein n=1 Tax=Peronosclerospora sorghi TaxID=230839 RepID=A0ACC0WKG3_9STRA|nr:hypothetical protein PsorP6_017740 [Peronosclerospora sorghi]
MKLRLIFSLVGTALPALVFAGDDDEIDFFGHATAKGLGAAVAYSCGEMNRYATINEDQYETNMNCGTCIKVACGDDRCSNQSTSAIVYVVGKCDHCQDEEIDLAPEVFTQLTGGSASDVFSMRWEFIDCVHQTPIHDTPNQDIPTQDSGYQAGTVEAVAGSPTTVSILSEDEGGVEKTKQQSAVTTASEDTKSGSSSPLVVAFAVVGVVACIALAAIAFVIKKKAMMRKKSDSLLSRSFDTFSSPNQTKASIVKI